MKLRITPILFLLLAFAPVALGAADLPVLENRVIDQQKKMQRLRQGIEGQRALVKETRQKEESLFAELEGIETQLRQERNRLQKLQTALGRHEELLAEKQQEVENAEQARGKMRSHVQNRLAAYYRLGSLGMLNVVFSAQSLPDLLNAEEYFRRLIQSDKEAIRDYRQTLDQLAATKAALEEEKQKLVTALAGVREQEQRLAATKAARAALLKRVKTEKKLYQRALEEIEAAAQNLEATIARLKKEASERKGALQREIRSGPSKQRPTAAGSFASQKGRLDPPVPGTVTTRFGKNTKGKFGITTMENGIDIKTAPGTEVRAIHEGSVAYAGMLRGYGNIVIIDHGDHYYSLMSRLAEIRKQEGDAVGRGDVVGVMSEQEGLINEGLHFEIRHGTKPENPLHWLNNAKLKITAMPR